MRRIFFCGTWPGALLMVACLLAFQFADEPEFGKEVVARFRAYNEQRPTEKVYIHTDRDAYLTGETVWLKGTW